MKAQMILFIVRWIANSFGLWVAVRLLGTGVTPSEVDTSVGIFLLAGFTFSILNTLIRPILVILSLPAILLTLGLFTFVVNGFMVWLALQMTPGLSMTFLDSIFAGMFLSLINYIIGSARELQIMKKKEDN